MKTFINLIILVCCINTSISAQKKERKRARIERSPIQDLQYDDVNYLSAIKTVQCYNSQEEQSLPQLTLNGDQQLYVSFDDLRADNRTFYYTIEHCTSDWKSSNLSTIEYIDGLTEDRIFDYKSSVNTLQSYTHYHFTFPGNGSMTPKIAGNYLLKVYEDADQSRLLFTRRFYVIKQDIGVDIQLLPSFNVAKRKKNQKLNVELHLGRLEVNNPYQDMKLIVTQNRRNDIKEVLSKPMFVKSGQLIYNNNTTLDFGGGNEFRNLDLRSFRLLSAQISEGAVDSSRKIMLIPDHDLSTETYSFSYDEQGKFFIRNSDFEDQDVEGDYAWVTFTLELQQEPENNEKVYVVGLFNDFQMNRDNELTYMADKKVWQGSVLLKQGVYQYTYKSVVDGKELANKYNGDHYETGNSYEVFIYYRKPATRWEELIGFGSVSTSSNRD